EPAALADGRADEAGLGPVAQPRLLDGENAGDIADAVQLDHGVLRSRWLSTSTEDMVRSQPAARRASATAIRRACSRQRSSLAYRNAIRCAVEASGGSLITCLVLARSTVSMVDPA